MAINIEAVRRAYFAPPAPTPPDHIPTREELIAWYEQRAVRHCIEGGRDPRAEGLGEHGSLIGGPDKPLRIFGRSPENVFPIEAMPLDWFSYPKATKPIDGPRRTGPQEEHLALAMLAARHLAGVPNRPSGTDLARIFRALEITDEEAFFLEQLFAAIFPSELRLLIAWERLSIFEIARAIHLSGTRRAHVIRWINQFAVPPSPPSTAAAHDHDRGRHRQD